MKSIPRHSLQSSPVFLQAFLVGLLTMSAPVIETGRAAEARDSAAAAAIDQASRPSNQQDVVRIGIAPGTWGGVNRNDATAAIKAWAKAIMSQRGAAVDVETTLFDSKESMSAALESGRIDAVSMLSDQFLNLAPELRPESIYLTTRNNTLTEQYVLLVHRNSGIADVSGLKGQRLVLQANSRTSLAVPWLDILLGRRSLGSATNVLKTITRIESPSKVILQVFFHQADACLVTSNMFALASELNPQIRKELKVLAASPEVVPSLFYFRPAHISIAREQLEPAILTLHETPAGQQVLTVFQSERMVKRPVSCLDATRAMMAEYNRLISPPENRERRAANLHQSGPANLGNPQ